MATPYKATIMQVRLAIGCAGSVGMYPRVGVLVLKAQEVAYWGNPKGQHIVTERNQRSSSEYLFAKYVSLHH